MVMGGVHQTNPDRTRILIGAAPTFWVVFKSSAEYSDGKPHPIDRWSTRVLGRIASEKNAEVEFPFGGPPYAPFIKWAIDSGQCHTSPIGMLVHPATGLMISFRGALNVAGHLPLPKPTTSPCVECSAPCATACPVGALGRDTPYDVAACKAHIQSEAGKDCLEAGCLARRACPVSHTFGRDPAQSGFHMAAFLKG